MFRVTFECESGLSGDPPVKFVFFRKNCEEFVAFHGMDSHVEIVTLNAFIEIMHTEKLRRKLLKRK